MTVATVVLRGCSDEKVSSSSIAFAFFRCYSHYRDYAPERIQGEFPEMEECERILGGTKWPASVDKVFIAVACFVHGTSESRMSRASEFFWSEKSDFQRSEMFSKIMSANAFCDSKIASDRKQGSCLSGSARCSSEHNQKMDGIMRIFGSRSDLRCRQGACHVWITNLMILLVSFFLSL